MASSNPVANNDLSGLTQLTIFPLPIEAGQLSIISGLTMPLLELLTSLGITLLSLHSQKFDSQIKLTLPATSNALTVISVVTIKESVDSPAGRIIPVMFLGPR